MQLAPSKFQNAIPGPFVISSRQVQGTIICVDNDGFGMVEFVQPIVGDQPVQLGFFSLKTELAGRDSSQLQKGLSAIVVTEATDMQIPEKAGPLVLTISRMEFKT